MNDYAKQIAEAVFAACEAEDGPIEEVRRNLDSVLASVPRPEPVIELGQNGSADRYFYEAGYRAGQKSSSTASAEPVNARLLDALRFYAEAEPISLYSKEHIEEFQRTAREAIAAAEQAKTAPEGTK